MMIEPIIIIENGDISVFESLNKLYKYIEIVDIKNNEYLAYDSKGLRLKFEIVEDNNNYFNLLGFKYNIEKLSFEIIKFLKRIKVDDELERLDLSELINLLIEKIGYTE